MSYFRALPQTPLGELTERSPRSPSWILGGPTSKGRGGRGREKGERGRREGKGKMREKEGSGEGCVMAFGGRTPPAKTLSCSNRVARQLVSLAQQTPWWSIHERPYTHRALQRQKVAKIGVKGHYCLRCGVPVYSMR